MVKKYNDGLGESLKRIFRNRNIKTLASATLAAVAGTLIRKAIVAAIITAKKAKAGKTKEFVKKVQSGEITEEKLVRDFVNDFTEKGFFEIDANIDDAKIDQLAEAFRSFRKARTFEEARRFFDIQELKDLAEKYYWAKNQPRLDSKMGINMRRKQLITHDSMPWTNKNEKKHCVHRDAEALRKKRARRNLDAAIRRYDDFDFKSKLAEMKAWFAKVKEDLMKYGKEHPIVKLYVKNMLRAIALSTAVLAGKSAQSDIAKLQKINADLKSGYIDMGKVITNSGVEYRTVMPPSKILIGLKMFVAVLSSIVGIAIRRSYSTGEKMANIGSMFFGNGPIGSKTGEAIVSAVSGGRV